MSKSHQDSCAAYKIIDRSERPLISIFLGVILFSFKQHIVPLLLIELFWHFVTFIQGVKAVKQEIDESTVSGARVYKAPGKFIYVIGLAVD